MRLSFILSFFSTKLKNSTEKIQMYYSFLSHKQNKLLKYATSRQISPLLATVACYQKSTIIDNIGIHVC